MLPDTILFDATHRSKKRQFHSGMIDKLEKHFSPVLTEPSISISSPGDSSRPAFFCFPLGVLYDSTITDIVRGNDGLQSNVSTDRLQCARLSLETLIWR